MDFIKLLSPHLVGDAPTNEALASMTQYYTLIHPSWHNDLQHVVHWCNLADYFSKHKQLQLTAPLNFVVDNHETDCYWYEVLWRVWQLSERLINDIVDELAPQVVPAKIVHDASRLASIQQQIQQTVGAIRFSVDAINTHCHWAKRHMEDVFRDVQDNWVVLRLLGYWAHACAMYGMNELTKASSEWHAMAKVQLEKLAYHTPKRASLAESLHNNGVIFCNVALATRRREVRAFGYAIAHYRAANMLGYALSEDEQKVQKDNERLLMPIPAPDLDIISGMVVPVPPLFMKGEMPLGKVKLVFKG